MPTAEELSSQSEQLQNMIAFFKIEGHTGTALSNMQARPVQIAHAGQKSSVQPALRQGEANTGGNGKNADVKINVSGRKDDLDQEFERY